MTSWRVGVWWMILGSLAVAQSPDIYERVKRALTLSGQGEEATAELHAKDYVSVEKKLASVNPQNDGEKAELQALRGAVKFLNGQMAEAATAFQESQKIHPLSASDRFTLAMALVNLGDGQARGILTGLAREHPDAPLYWYWLGRLDFDQRRYSESVEKLQRATGLDPNLMRAWDSLGLAWDMKGRVEPARAAFERATSLNRTQAHPSPWPPHNLGYLLLRVGELDTAEKALRESLSYDGKLARSHSYLARVLEKQNRENEAVEEYRKAVATDLQAADACYSLALLYRKLHREAEADSMFAEFKKRKRGS